MNLDKTRNSMGVLLICGKREHSRDCRIVPSPSCYHYQIRDMAVDLLVPLCRYTLYCVHLITGG